MYLIWAKLLHSSALFGSFLPAPGENGRKCLGRDALHGDHQHGRILETSEHGALVPFKGNETIGKTTGKVVKTIGNSGKNHSNSGEKHRKWRPSNQTWLAGTNPINGDFLMGKSSINEGLAVATFYYRKVEMLQTATALDRTRLAEDDL